MHISILNKPTFKYTLKKLLQTYQNIREYLLKLFKLQSSQKVDIRLNNIKILIKLMKQLKQTQVKHINYQNNKNQLILAEQAKNLLKQYLNQININKKQNEQKNKNNYKKIRKYDLYSHLKYFLQLIIDKVNQIIPKNIGLLSLNDNIIKWKLFISEIYQYQDKINQWSKQNIQQNYNDSRIKSLNFSVKYNQKYQQINKNPSFKLSYTKNIIKTPLSTNYTTPIDLHISFQQTSNTTNNHNFVQKNVQYGRRSCCVLKKNSNSQHLSQNKILKRKKISQENYLYKKNSPSVKQFINQDFKVQKFKKSYHKNKQSRILKKKNTINRNFYKNQQKNKHDLPNFVNLLADIYLGKVKSRQKIKQNQITEVNNKQSKKLYQKSLKDLKRQQKQKSHIELLKNQQQAKNIYFNQFINDFQNKKQNKSIKLIQINILKQDQNKLFEQTLIKTMPQQCVKKRQQSLLKSQKIIGRFQNNKNEQENKKKASQADLNNLTTDNKIKHNNDLLNQLIEPKDNQHEQLQQIILDDNNNNNSIQFQSIQPRSQKNNLMSEQQKSQTLLNYRRKDNYISRSQKKLVFLKQVSFPTDDLQIIDYKTHKVLKSEKLIISKQLIQSTEIVRRKGLYNIAQSCHQIKDSFKQIQKAELKKMKELHDQYIIKVGLNQEQQKQNIDKISKNIIQSKTNITESSKINEFYSYLSSLKNQHNLVSSKSLLAEQSIFFTCQDRLRQQKTKKFNQYVELMKQSFSNKSILSTFNIKTEDQNIKKIKWMEKQRLQAFLADQKWIQNYIKQNKKIQQQVQTDNTNQIEFLQVNLVNQEW